MIIRRILLVTAGLFTVSPAFAQTAMDCTESNMTAAEQMGSKMSDGDSKKMAMEEMGMAKTAMSTKKMDECKIHINKAMEMMKQTP